MLVVLLPQSRGLSRPCPLPLDRLSRLDYYLLILRIDEIADSTKRPLFGTGKKKLPCYVREWSSFENRFRGGCATTPMIAAILAFPLMARRRQKHTISSLGPWS